MSAHEASGGTLLANNDPMRAVTSNLVEVEWSENPAVPSTDRQHELSPFGAVGRWMADYGRNADQVI